MLSQQSISQYSLFIHSKVIIYSFFFYAFTKFTLFNSRMYTRSTRFVETKTSTAPELGPGVYNVNPNPKRSHGKLIGLIIFIFVICHGIFISCKRNHFWSLKSSYLYSFVCSCNGSILKNEKKIPYKQQYSSVLFLLILFFSFKSNDYYFQYDYLYYFTEGQAPFGSLIPRKTMTEEVAANMLATPAPGNC